MNTPEDRKPAVDELAARRLERQLDGLLRALPDQAAPAGFAERVLARLEAEARLPWYRRGFARWPNAARVLFLPVSLAAVAASMGIASRVGAALPATANLPAIERVDGTLAALRAAGSTLGHLFTQAVPMPWLYAAAAIGVAAYLMTLLLGVLAVRTLVPQPHRA